MESEETQEVQEPKPEKKSPFRFPPRLGAIILAIMGNGIVFYVAYHLFGFLVELKEDAKADADLLIALAALFGGLVTLGVTSTFHLAKDMITEEKPDPWPPLFNKALGVIERMGKR